MAAVAAMPSAPREADWARGDRVPCWEGCGAAGGWHRDLWIRCARSPWAGGVNPAAARLCVKGTRESACIPTEMEVHQLLGNQSTSVCILVFCLNESCHDWPARMSAACTVCMLRSKSVNGSLIQLAIT